MATRSSAITTTTSATPRRSRELGVEQRDDEHRDEVVHDGQGRQEQAQRDGQAPTHECEDAQRERDVRGHRDAPARCPRTSHVEREVDDRGQDGAADGRHDGQHRRAGLAQLAQHQLALDLEPDHEEEHHHQAVVDHVVQGHLERLVAHDDADVRLPQGVPGVAHGRVGEQQRHDRGSQQQDRAACFLAQELAQRVEQPGGSGHRDRLHGVSM